MGKLTKITFGSMIVSAVAAMLFLTGIIDVSKVPGLYLVFPLAAVLFGVFVILFVFEKDAAKIDEEQHPRKHNPPDIQPHNVEQLHDHEHAHDKSIAA